MWCLPSKLCALELRHCFVSCLAFPVSSEPIPPATTPNMTLMIIGMILVGLNKFACLMIPYNWAVNHFLLFLITFIDQVGLIKYYLTN